MSGDLTSILRQLQNERNVDRDVLIEAIKAAVTSAWNKSVHHADEVDIELDEDTMQLSVFELKTVVDTDNVGPGEVGLAEARETDPAAAVGDTLRIEVTPRNFGRIAAQTAKQVIRQRIKDAENRSIFEEFSQRKGNLVTGVVKRYARGNVIIDLGRTEAILPFREQSRLDNYRVGDRTKAFVLDVEETSRNPQVVLSRAAPDFVKELFELEVPEIYDSTIEIKGIAREAGYRTKMAVVSHDSNVDAVGACVGMKGVRVRTIMDELNGEKIDIVKWNPETTVYISNALNPAQIRTIAIDEDAQSATVIVPKDQLSLAIGKKGQNARLAAKLTGWQIDIISDEEASEMVADEADELEPDEGDVDNLTGIVEELMQVPGLSEMEALSLIEVGYDSLEAVAASDTETMLAVEGLEPEHAAIICEAAISIVEKVEAEPGSVSDEPAADESEDAAPDEDVQGRDAEKRTASDETDPESDDM